MKTKGKIKFIACILTLSLLVSLIPATASFAATELPGGTYSLNGWAYIWDATTKKLDISDDAAKLAGATAIPDLSGIKDFVESAAFIDKTKLTNAFKAKDYFGNKIKTLDMSGADTSAMTEMSGMFAVGENGECASLESIELKNMDTSNVKTMHAMFLGLQKLKSLDLSGFNTRKVNAFTSMFSNCGSLKNLDLTSFVFDGGNDSFILPLMFEGCTSLETLNMSGLYLEKNTGVDVFKGCTSLLKFETPKGMGSKYGELPYEMYEDDPNDEYAMTTPYKTSIPDDKTIWRKHAVTYKTENGSAEIAKQNVKYGQAAAPNKITPPSKPGFTFQGWGDGNENIVDLTKITAPVTVQAIYKRNDTPPPPTTTTASVTFKIENGTWNDNSVADKIARIQKGTPLAARDIPTGMKAKQGYTFGRWSNPAPNTTYIINNDTTYVYTFIPDVQAIKVTFKVVNGKWADNTTADKIIAIEKGKTLVTADIPTGMKPNSGYSGGKWNPQPNTLYTLNADTTYIYTFSSSGGGGGSGGGSGGSGGGGTGGSGGGGGSGSSTSTEYTLTYETNGGTAIASEKYASGKEVSLTKTTSRVGYGFTGWYSDSACKNKIEKIKMDGNKTVYAGWEKKEWSVSDVFNTKEHFAYIVGLEDGKVHPDANITRAQTATVLYRLLTTATRDSIFTSSNNFSDVTGGLWYNKAVSSMAKGGFIKGYEDGTFAGGKSITRAEFVTMVVRFLGTEDGAVSKYTDVSTNHWAYKYIATATEAGWINGYVGNTFAPDQNITRAEAMTIVNRLLDRGVDKNSDITGHKVWPDNPSGEWYYYEVIEATNDHAHTGTRPSENWTGLSIDYKYDRTHYEMP